MKKSELRQLIKEEIQTIIKQEEMEILAKKMTQEVKNLGKFLKNKGYNV
jgi:hypothetical protein